MTPATRSPGRAVWWQAALAFVLRRAEGFSNRGLGFVWFFLVTAVFFCGHSSQRAYLDVYLLAFAAGPLEGRRRRHFRPEAELLLHCARADALEGDRLIVLARKGVAKEMDWGALAEAAEYHGLAPILHQVLDRTCPELVPGSIASRLRDCYRDSAKRNLIFTARLLALLDAFATAGIPVVPLKGPVLAEALYSDPVLRPFSDLDLLVRKRDVPAAVSLLAREGYALGPHLARVPVQVLMGLQCELLFRQEHMPPVDLQWETGPADYPFRCDAEILWQSLRPARIAGREVPGLSGESRLLFLCVHGTKHAWSRLQWLGDIARLARSPLDWARVWELATEAGCRRPLLLGLLLAHELLAAPVPEAIVESARAARAIQPLARQVVARLHRIPPTEPESLELTMFNARMAEGTWGKVRHYAALLKAPTEAELELLSLPEKLFFLYYPLRAARLAVKYGSRLVGR